MGHWRRKWQPTPVFLPGGPHGQHEKAESYDARREAPQVRRRPCSLPAVGELVPSRVRGCVHRSGRRGGLGGLPTLRWWCVQGHVQSPAFAPGCLEMAVGVSRSLCIFCPGFALPCACVQLFLILYSLFLFCCLRRCLSRCRQFSTAAKGPGSSLFPWWVF